MAQSRLSSEIGDFVSRMYGSAAVAQPQLDSCTTDIEAFFDDDEWSAMTDVCKRSLLQLKQNYELLKMCGIDTPMPEFMAGGKKEKKSKICVKREIKFCSPASFDHFAAALEASSSSGSKKRGRPKKIPTQTLTNGYLNDSFEHNDWTLPPKADRKPKSFRVQLKTTTTQPSQSNARKRRPNPPASRSTQSRDVTAAGRRRPSKMKDAPPRKFDKTRKVSVGKRGRPPKKTKRDPVLLDCQTLLDELVTQVAGPRVKEKSALKSLAKVPAAPPVSKPLVIPGTRLRVQRAAPIYESSDESESEDEYSAPLKKARKMRRPQPSRRLLEKKKKTPLVRLPADISSPQELKQRSRVVVQGREKFSCHFCALLFSKMDGLKRHLREIHQFAFNPESLRKYECKSCRIEFKRPEGFRRHQLRHHGITVKPEPSSSRPAICVTGSSSLDCDVCGKSFGTRRLWTRHRRRTHGIYTIGPSPQRQLELSNQKSSSKDRVKQEQTADYKRPASKFKSPNVSRSRTLRKYLRNKLRTPLHAKRRRLMRLLAKLKCDDCFKLFRASRLAAFAGHRRVHENKSHRCPSCGIRFRAAACLADHLRRSHDSAALQLKCRKCKTCFTSQREGRAHFFACPGKVVIVSQQSLTAVKKEETDSPVVKAEVFRLEEPVVCPYCARKFYNPNYFERHLRMHSKARPHQCALCPKSYSKRYHLARHCKETHGVGVRGEPLPEEAQPRYECNVCGYAFRRASHLDRHKKVGRCCEAALRVQERLLRAEENSIRMVTAELKDSESLLCASCGSVFASRKCLIRHERNVHSFYRKIPLLPLDITDAAPDAPLFACKYCERVFKCREYMNKHTLFVHEITPEGKKPAASFVCQFCGKAFKCRSYVSRHERDVHKARKGGQPGSASAEPTEEEMLNAQANPKDCPWVCARCGKAFAAQRYLAHHEYRAHGDGSYLRPEARNRQPDSPSGVAISEIVERVPRNKPQRFQSRIPKTPSVMRRPQAVSTASSSYSNSSESNHVSPIPQSSARSSAVSFVSPPSTSGRVTATAGAPNNGHALRSSRDHGAGVSANSGVAGGVSSHHQQALVRPGKHQATAAANINHVIPPAHVNQLQCHLPTMTSSTGMPQNIQLQDVGGFLNEFFLTNSAAHQNLQGAAYQQPNGSYYTLL